MYRPSPPANSVALRSAKPPAENAVEPIKGFAIKIYLILFHLNRIHHGKSRSTGET